MYVRLDDVSSSRIPPADWRLLGLFAVFLGFVGPAPAAAQTVHGRLLEQGTGRPIEAGTVVLLGAASVEVDRAETDSVGRFTLRSPDPGTFYVRAQRIGYRGKTDGVLELGEGGEITIDFYLMPEPIELEGLEGTVEGMSPLERRDREYLESQGFYHRKKIGFGHFITPEELEERQPFDFIDLFSRVPFVRGAYSARGGDGIWMTARGGGGLRGGNGYCRPTVIVDRSPTSQPAVEAIVGVEVYRGFASVPIEFSGYANSCGLVLIWTKG